MAEPGGWLSTSAATHARSSPSSMSAAARLAATAARHRVRDPLGARLGPLQPRPVPADGPALDGGDGGDQHGAGGGLRVGLFQVGDGAGDLRQAAERATALVAEQDAEVEADLATELGRRVVLVEDPAHRVHHPLVGPGELGSAGQLGGGADAAGGPWIVGDGAGVQVRGGGVVAVGGGPVGGGGEVAQPLARPAARQVQAGQVGERDQPAVAVEGAGRAQAEPGQAGAGAPRPGRPGGPGGAGTSGTGPVPAAPTAAAPGGRPAPRGRGSGPPPRPVRRRAPAGPPPPRPRPGVARRR